MRPNQRNRPAIRVDLDTGMGARGLLGLGPERVLQLDVLAADGRSERRDEGTAVQNTWGSIDGYDMSTESAVSCPSDQTLARFSEGLLSPDAAAEMEAHLDACADCREVVAVAAGDWTVSRREDDSNRTNQEPGPGEESGPGERGAAPQLGDTVGRYRLLRPLGEGAMGVVYAAHDPELDRTVAVKIVKAASHASQSRRERVVREARALAKLSHPHVVSVFDVGECPAGLFIVMELVEGDDLRRWCRERTWTEIVDCFIAAGRGLVAAHDAGLTHRDFKPSNVLVGDDGRVRVTDFGLAGTLAAATSEVSAGSGDPDPPSARLTRTGEVMGTPAYMSPEQFGSRTVTAASDQFSFCVALAEAIGGKRPTVGRTLADLAGSVESADTRVDLGESGAPESLAVALRQGLSADPVRRFGSMNELVVALQRVLGRANRRRGGVLLVAASLAAVGVAAVLAVGPRDDRCERVVAELSPQVDDTQQAAIHRRLEKSAKRYGEQTAQRVEQQLSSFVADWGEARLGLCEAATTQSGEGEFLDQAVRCLERQRDEFEATVAVLAEDETPLRHAVAVAVELGEPAACLDPDGLYGELVVPAGARADVRRLEAVIAEVKALVRAFRFKDVKARLDSEQAFLDSVDWLPVRAEATFYRAVADGVLGNREAEISGLADAYELAVESGYDRIALRAAAALVTAAAFGAGDFEESDRWYRAAEAIADRTGAPQHLSDAMRSRAEVSLRRSRFDEARDLAERALQLYRSDTERPHDSAIASLQGTIGTIGLFRRDYVSAKHSFEAQLEAYEMIYGSEHPRCSGPLLGLIQVAQAQRDWDTASDLLDQREAIVLDVFGPNSSRYANDLELRSFVEEGRGDLEEALRLAEAALETTKSVLGEKHPDLGGRHGRVGTLNMRLKNHQVAQEHHLEAVEICQSAFEVVASCGVTSNHNLGESLSALGRHDEAIEAYGRALEIADELYGPDGPNRAFPLTGLGEVYLAEGEYDEARAKLRESLRVASGHPGNRSEWAETAFALARALAESPDVDDADRREALELAQEAVARYAESPGRADELRTVRDWLAEQP